MQRRSSIRCPLPGFYLLLAIAVLPSETAGQAWVPKGPAPALKGFNVAVPGNQITGALEAVVAHPGNSNVLWVGSVNGGIFRTDNANAAMPYWIAQTDSLGSLSIGALELDPTDGTFNTLVAGIANQSAFFNQGGALTGLLRTTDGGASWSALPSLAGKSIVGLAPRGGTIVAAVDGPGNNLATIGIWRSTNGGASFSQISGAGGTGLPSGFAYDLASDPTDQARMFAPITGLNVSSDGLYRSTDSGATWSQVGSGTAMDTALESNRREVQVTVGRGGGVNANIFVAVCDSPGDLGSLKGLFYSGDAGNTWAALDMPMTNESGTAFGIHPGNQCDAHLSLVADPVDHSVVYIGGDRQPAANEAMGGGTLPNSLGAVGFTGRLFRVDADQPSGSQATTLTHCGTSTPSGCGGVARTASNSAPHADSREMVFDASGNLIEVDDGGVYRRTDPLGNSGDWFSLNGNLQASEQHDVAYDSFSNILMAGLQDNGAVGQTEASNNVWDQLRGGDGGDVVVGFNDPGVGGGGSLRYFSSQMLGGLQRVAYDADNQAVGMAFPTLTPLGGANPPIGVFTTPLEVNAVQPWRLLVGAGNGLYESLDRLDSVSFLSNVPVGNGQNRPALAYGVASDVNAIYHGTNANGFQNQLWARIAPFALAITAAPGGGVDTDAITDVVIDPANSATAVAVDRNSVYGTNNPFASWSNVTGNLFTATGAGDINTVEYFNNGAGYRIVVGTDTGVYQAFSPFTSWSQLGAGLPNAPVYEIKYDPQNNLLVAGTMGRGAWTLSLSTTCPWERSFAGTTLSSPQTNKAVGFIVLGPNLTVNNGAGINMDAGDRVAFYNETAIGGTFTASNASCP